MGSQRTDAKGQYLLRFYWVCGDDGTRVIYFQCVADSAQTSNNLLHQMGKRGPLSSAIRTFVVGSFVRGYLASLDEGAMVAGVDRSTVLRWLRAERIDWQANRIRYLAGQRNKAVRISEGKSVKRPSKKEQHLEADRLKREWDKANAARLEGISSAGSGDPH